MSSVNYQISQIIDHDRGSRLFVWLNNTTLNRVGTAMPAVFDFDENGRNYRIEILYIQAILSDLDRPIGAEKYSGEGEIILQVGVENPTSFILWIDALHIKKSSNHTTGDAWLLEDEEGRIAGIEVVPVQSTCL